MNVSLHDFALSVLRIGIWLVLLTMLFVPLERWCSARHAPLRKRAWCQDLAYYMISSLVQIVLLSVPAALLAVAASHVVPASLMTAVAGLPPALRMALAFLVGEIGYYWGHRLGHELPWLWRFHALHHSSEPLHSCRIPARIRSTWS